MKRAEIVLMVPESNGIVPGARLFDEALVSNEYGFEMNA